MYMFYVVFYGPYRTTFAHLAIVLGFCFTIYFMSSNINQKVGALKFSFNMILVLLTIYSVSFVIINLDRILASWGAAFLTRQDIIVGSILVLLVLEAARRESFAFFILSSLGIAYIIFGNYTTGVFSHAGMSFDRFIYLTAFTAEGIFGIGLNVAASYLFMFMLLSSAMTQTKTGIFIMNICNAYLGRFRGGPAKSAVMASAGLGTMVGSSIGNVATTGTFTIPLMKQNGIPAHKAGAVETVSSEGSQFLPPVMGAGAFIMAEMTGIPYATIALAALIPACLYFLSLFFIVHSEAIKLDLKPMTKDQIPNPAQVMKDGIHLLAAPVVLFYLLMVEGFTPAFAGLWAIIVSILISALRRNTRLGLKGFFDIFIYGAKSTAAIVALIAAIGFIQQALVTTGLAPRLTSIILVFTYGSMLLALFLSVIAATALGMGMPTPIAYILLALFVAPALTTLGVDLLAAHLFLFYFAIKSGSTPPVAMVAIVAAGIAGANWWKTSVQAFIYSIPSFIIAFMFVYTPELLFIGDIGDVILATVMAAIGICGFAGCIQGYFFYKIRIVERILLLAASFLLVKFSLTTDIIGLIIVVIVLFVANRRDERENPQYKLGG